MDRRLLDRRKFLTGASLAGAGLAAGCDCGDLTEIQGLASSRPRRELTMVTTWPKDFPGLGTAAENLARWIGIMSEGTLNIRVLAAGELVGAFEAFDAVSNGAADFYHGADYYWVGKSPAFSFFAAVPFGMTAMEIMAWLEYGGGQELWDELAARFNVKPFQAGNTGHQWGGWYKREINSLSDLRGRRIRMPGQGGEVLRRLGAAAVAIPGGEIYQALQSGAIDGSEWIGPWNDLAFGFYREAPYYYAPGFHEPGTTLSLGVNLELWNDLSDAEQEIIRAASRAANHQTIAQFAHFNAVALRVLVEEHGVALRSFPDDVMEAAAAAARDVMIEASEADEFTGRVFASFREAVNRGYRYSERTEEAYMAIRRRVFAL